MSGAHVPYRNAVLQDDYCHADGEPWPCLHHRQTAPHVKCAKGCLCLCHEGIGDVEHLGRPCYGKPGSTDVSDYEALPPYSRKPITTPDGMPVVGWGWPPAPVAEPEDDGPENIEPGDRCHECGGWGTWTETVEGSDGRDVDVDIDCGVCGATGIEP